MVNFSQADVINHQVRMAKNRPSPTRDDAPELESTLRTEIDKFCNEQWPKWLVVAARTDKKSTIPTGCHDCTIFASRGRVFCLELKSKTGKPTQEQLGWAVLMRNVGHTVHLIRSMSEFLEIVK